MHIDHVAVWTKDLDRLAAFYMQYFGAVASDRYFNPHRQFSSCCLTFASGARLELMHRPDLAGPDLAGPDLAASAEAAAPYAGYAHLALALGSEAEVNALTTRLREDGYALVDGPRHTGDGCYESCLLDPDGNRIELTL